jgi:hypothetical protein
VVVEEQAGDERPSRVGAGFVEDRLEMVLHCVHRKVQAIGDLAGRQAPGRRVRSRTVDDARPRRTRCRQLLVPGGARESADLDAIVQDAVNGADLDAFVNTHDDDATVVVPPDG